MIYLLLSILSSCCIYLVFKYISIFKISILPVIIVNYFVAFVLGIGFTETALSELTNSTEATWFWFSLYLGVMFILVFNLMAKTTASHGVGVVSVASKMSLSIPVLFVFLYYGEAFTWFKFIGFVLALVAVFLISYSKPSSLNQLDTSNKFNLLLPVLMFLGSGIIESSIKFAEEELIPNNEVANFSAFVFLTAGCCGLVFTVIQKFLKTEVLNDNANFKKTLVAGIALGVPNFFSIYFFILALKSEILTSAAVFIVNNVAIVILATLLGIVLFKEEFKFKNKLGIALAILSICLIFLGE